MDCSRDAEDALTFRGTASHGHVLYVLTDSHRREQFWRMPGTKRSQLSSGVLHDLITIGQVRPKVCDVEVFVQQ